RASPAGGAAASWERFSGADSLPAWAPSAPKMRSSVQSSLEPGVPAGGFSCDPMARTSSSSRRHPSHIAICCSASERSEAGRDPDTRASMRGLTAEQSMLLCIGSRGLILEPPHEDRAIGGRGGPGRQSVSVRRGYAVMLNDLVGKNRSLDRAGLQARVAAHAVLRDDEEPAGALRVLSFPLLDAVHGADVDAGALAFTDILHDQVRHGTSDGGPISARMLSDFQHPV